MVEIPTFERVLWSVTVLLKAGLVVLLLYRKNYRAFPYFFGYALLNFLQSMVLLVSYRSWGLNSTTSLEMAWGAQGIVTLARACAVAEFCHRILAKYCGIWQVVWRLLLIVAAVVSAYSLAFSMGSWQIVILYLDRGLELAMASVLVLFFLSARYYDIEVEPASGMLATGLLLYSCFRVLNDTLLERFLHGYATVWNVLGALAFLASLLLWSWALRKTLPKTISGPEMLPEGFYHKLAPEINNQLKTLNEHLSHFWSVRGRKT